MAEKTVKVKYELDHHYVGSDRPIFVSIPESEFSYCKNEQDRRAVAEEYIKQDMEQRLIFEFVEG
jgi:hypothetical protein